MGSCSYQYMQSQLLAAGEGHNNHLNAIPESIPQMDPRHIAYTLARVHSKAICLHLFAGSQISPGVAPQTRGTTFCGSCSLNPNEALSQLLKCIQGLHNSLPTQPAHTHILCLKKKIQPTLHTKISWLLDPSMVSM